MNYKGYKELESYIKARELRIDISELVKKIPSSEKFQLVSQIIHSSRFVTANISEGYGRFTYTDTRHFFIIARGSTTETMEHLTTAFDEKCQTIIKLINGYINFLDKSKATK